MARLYFRRRGKVRNLGAATRHWQHGPSGGPVDRELQGSDIFTGWKLFVFRKRRTWYWAFEALSSSLAWRNAARIDCGRGQPGDVLAGWKADRFCAAIEYSGNFELAGSQGGRFGGARHCRAAGAALILGGGPLLVTGRATDCDRKVAQRRFSTICSRNGGG